ncbi:MAG: flagellar hook-basal body complex protein [Selenomonadaceae bacterium]|nr:flagellar hook-basal body complex protein [Selenomonadaceae bacterium]
MMRSLFSGVSGLKNHQTRMDVIGNNISNVNTTGFKSSRVTFVDMLSQTQTGASAPKGNIGGTNPKQIGLGSSVGSIDLMFQDGSVQSTGKNTDLCLSGNGLFVMKRGNETFYTRDGAFEFDAEGNYVLPGSGLFVQGWMGKDGTIDTTTQVGNITVAAGKSMPANATSQVTYANNLNSDIPMVTGVTGGVNTRMTTIAKDDISATIPLKVTIGGVECTVTAIDNDLDLSKAYKVVTTDGNPLPSGSQSIPLEDEDGNKLTLTVTATTAAIPNGSGMSITSNIIPKSSVTTADPLTVTIDGKNYTVTEIGSSIDLTKSLTVKTAADSGNTITVNDGTSDIALTVTPDLTADTAVAADAVAKPVTASIASTENPVTLTLSDGTTIVQTSGTYQVGNSMPVTTTITVYDSLGATHEIPVYFIREGEVKDGVVNSIDKWLVSLEPDASVKKGEATTFEFVEDNGTKTTVTLNVAEIQFTSSGKIVTNSTSADVPDTSKGTTLVFTGGSIGTPGTEPGLPETQSVNIDFSALTQFSGNNTINGTSNGNAAGTLKEIQIDSSGVITGVYTNGVRQAEAQVAVAQFTNATGLTKTGNSLYQESNNSGTANIKTASDLGVTITPSALEMSNVDVANEFADMIVTQRGFQSNSKIVTVGDEMLETVINMKR